MREGFVRTLEALVATAATYMAAVTMVQTTLYNKLLGKISNSFIGPIIDPYMPYVNITVILLVLFEPSASGGKATRCGSAGCSA